MLGRIWQCSHFLVHVNMIKLCTSDRQIITIDMRPTRTEIAGSSCAEMRVTYVKRAPVFFVFPKRAFLLL